MEESCALCEKRATMYCDADQAKLCWNCDGKVHAANFLVAKHCRVLLCRLCHSPTSWKASGPRLVPTVSFCHLCVVDRHARYRQLPRNDRQHCDYERVDMECSCNDSNNHDSDGDEKDEKIDEKGKNQVIPMAASSSLPPSGALGLSFKRLRNNSFTLDSHDATVCSSSEVLCAAFPSGDKSTSMRLLTPPLKKHRINQQNC